MDVKYINPFLKSVANVLETMASIKPNPGKPYARQDRKTWGVVTGLIGMAGEQINGNMILSFDKASILTIVSNMLGEKFVEIDDQVVDATGELTNMISGGAKADFSELGINMDMAIPVVLVGEGMELKQLSRTPIIVIPFETPAGKFVVETNLNKKA